MSSTPDTATSVCLFGVVASYYSCCCCVYSACPSSLIYGNTTPLVSAVVKRAAGLLHDLTYLSLYASMHYLSYLFITSLSPNMKEKLKCSNGISICRDKLGTVAILYTNKRETQIGLVKNIDIMIFTDQQNQLIFCLDETTNT